MATSEAVKQRIAAFACELSEELGEVDDSDALSWLDAIETEAVEIGDAVQAELVKQRSAAGAVEDESVCPDCDRQGCYREPRQREMIGRRGPVSVAEPEYYCPLCRRAFFPEDGRDRR